MSIALDFKIEEAYAGQRLDKVLDSLVSDISRSRLQALIKEGFVNVNETSCTQSSRKLRAGDRIVLTVPLPAPSAPEPEDIPLDILYEDEDVIVVNKKAGMVVHPGAGNFSGTLVNALLHRCGESLSGIGGVVRPGIVHRLDKDTSGVMIAAKNDKAHQSLSAQLADRSLSRLYKALVFKEPVPRKGVIDRPIGRDSKNRLKMAVNNRNGRAARTHYTVKTEYRGACALVECALESGRTHQIRVHMASIKHPLVGDPLYGPQPTALRAMLKKSGYGDEIVEKVLSFPRQALHAETLSFIHPVTQESMTCTAPMPDDFSTLLKRLAFEPGGLKNTC